jgi:hypothetical protein
MATELANVGEFVASAFCQFFGAVSPGSRGRFRWLCSDDMSSSRRHGKRVLPIFIDRGAPPCHHSE